MEKSNEDKFLKSRKIDQRTKKKMATSIRHENRPKNYSRNLKDKRIL